MQASVSFPKKPAQGGYTLVELAIAVAILAVLIVAGLSGVQNIMTSSKVNDQIKTVARLSSKVSATFATTSTSGITTANMAGLGGWDTSKVSGGAVTSSFATSEFVATNPAAITDLPLNAGLIYTITKVPTGACADLATGISNVIYALKIQNAILSAAQSSWPATSEKVIEVKAPGAAINNISLATACALGTSLDFIIALKP